MNVHPTHVLANGECVNCEAADPNWNLPAPCLQPASSTGTLRVTDSEGNFLFDKKPVNFPHTPNLHEWLDFLRPEDT